jgi:hypothetical protein
MSKESQLDVLDRAIAKCLNLALTYSAAFAESGNREDLARCSGARKCAYELKELRSEILLAEV